MKLSHTISVGLVSTLSLVFVVAFAPTANTQEQFVGTWKLVSYEVGVTHPMGRDAVGFLIYDADGHMSLQIMRSDRPKFRTAGGIEGGYEAGTPEEVMSAYRGYMPTLVPMKSKKKNVLSLTTFKAVYFRTGWVRARLSSSNSLTTA